MPPPFLWLCHGWAGWGAKLFSRLFFGRETGSSKDAAIFDQASPVGYIVAMIPWRAHGSLSEVRGSMLVLVRDLAP